MINMNILDKNLSLHLIKLTCVFKFLVCNNLYVLQFAKNFFVYGDPKVGCFFALQSQGLIVRVIVLVSLLRNVCTQFLILCVV